MKVKELSSLGCFTCSTLLYLCWMNKQFTFISSTYWHYFIITITWIGMGVAWKTNSRTLTFIGFGGNAFLFCSVYAIPLLMGKGFPNPL